MTSEVLEAFHAFWTTGATDEDWSAWADHLTPDVEYVERQFGTMYGREAVRTWITELMVVSADVHAVLNWYIVAGDRVVLDMWNRYFHPDPEQPPIDFAGLTVLTYGSDGLFKREEDYWDQITAKTAYVEWTAACKEWGSKGDPDHLAALDAQRKADQLEALQSARIT
ncbi:MAG: nuclear transport factor 2 family protein [Mycobacteriales bacterium]